MDIRRAMPHPALRGVVQSFGERRGTLGTAVLTWPLPARPHQIIDIYLGDPFRLRIEGGALQTAPETVVVGPQGSRRIEIYVSGEVHIFNILLQPAALNRLIGIDMTSLVNEGIAAHDVLGKRAIGLDDAVRRRQTLPRVSPQRSVGLESWWKAAAPRTELILRPEFYWQRAAGPESIPFSSDPV